MEKGESVSKIEWMCQQFISTNFSVSFFETPGLVHLFNSFCLKRHVLYASVTAWPLPSDQSKVFLFESQNTDAITMMETKLPLFRMSPSFIYSYKSQKNIAFPSWNGQIIFTIFTLECCLITSQRMRHLSGADLSDGQNLILNMVNMFIWNACSLS